MQYGDRRVRIEREFIRFESPELYVGSERLGDLLGVMFAVDWADLTATVIDPSSLPIARRLRREAAREAYLRRPDGMRADVTLGLQRPSWDGVVVDYSLFAPSTDPLAGSTYGFGLGADVGGGSLEMLGQSVGPAELGRVHVDASWTGVWRENPWVRQLRLGDVASTGPRSRALEGVSITNAPFVRPSLIGSLRYAGSLEPGWSVEAYRGGDLVAYDSADASGGFSIALPVRYGENPVDFVAYGPFGEIREFNRTYRVLTELLPARQFEYGLAGGRCPQPSFICNATANLDLRYGATARWTVQGGLDQFWRDSLPDRTHPYATLVGNPCNEWAIQGEVVGAGLVRGALRYEPSVDLRLDGEYVHFARDSASVLAVPGRRAQWTVTGFLRPKTSHGFFFFDGRVERISTDAGTLTRTRLGASLQTDEMRLLPYVRTEHGNVTAGVGGGNNHEFIGLATFVMPRARWGRVLSQTLLRTHAEIERHAGAGSPDQSARRGPWPLTRTLRLVGPGLHGRERQRHPRCGRAGDRERAPAGRLARDPHRLNRRLSRLGPRAVRAGHGDSRLAVARVAALGPVVRTDQHRAGPQSLPESRHSRGRSRHHRRAGSAQRHGRRWGDAHSHRSPQQHPPHAGDLQRRRLLSHGGEARRLRAGRRGAGARCARRGRRAAAVQPGPDAERDRALRPRSASQVEVLAASATPRTTLSSFAKSYGFTSDGTPASRSNEDVSVANVSPVVKIRRFTIVGCSRRRRSEERRVGKEGRSRWSPYH